MTRDHALAPFALALLGVALFSVMDALMKGASLAIGAYSALLVRNLVGVVLSIPIWRAKGGRWPSPHVLRLHILRGCVTALMGLTFFYSLTLLPLAEAIALSFIAPLIALYLAGFWLKEKIERRSILASGMGLVGVTIIAAARIRGADHGSAASVGVIAVLISACLYAWNLVLQRRLAQLAEPWEIVSFQTGVAAVLLLLPAPFFAIWPDSAVTFAEIASAAFLGVIALLVLAWAYARADAQALVPLEYSAFIWAALLGWLIFDEAVQPETIIGTVLIVVACWFTLPRRHIEATAL